MLGWTHVVSLELLSPLQTTFCMVLFLGLLPFESPVFPHDPLLGCVREKLKQQTTDGIIIMDCCETLD